jgi:hypothetical protein
MDNSFDPLIFLGIKGIKLEEKKDLSERLLNKISQYLLIRIVDQLDSSLLKRTRTPDEIFSLAEDNIPDFNNQVKRYLEDFKKEFNLNIKTI